MSGRPASKTVRIDRGVLEEARLAAALMSNILYNLAQKSWAPDADRSLMDQQRRRWDAIAPNIRAAIEAKRQPRPAQAAPRKRWKK